MTDERSQFKEAMLRLYGRLGYPNLEEEEWMWTGWQAARAAPAQPAGKIGGQDEWKAHCHTLKIT